jgi:hypothetical protein
MLLVLMVVEAHKNMNFDVSEFSSTIIKIADPSGSAV